MTMWRDPDEESVDLYPNLVVWDGRVTGSITIGQSRLPIWAIIHTAITCDWDEVEDGWSPTEHYGFTQRDLASFLYNLLEMRGEFGRLLLMLANAERIESERDDEAMDGYGIVDISPWKEEAPPDELGVPTIHLPDPWWKTPEQSGPICEQMRRCIRALGEEP